MTPALERFHVGSAVPDCDAAKLPDKTPPTNWKRSVHLDITWTCPCCQQQFFRLPLAYAFAEPDAWRAIPAEERSQRGVIGTDSCTFDGRHFIRGRIVIPVAGTGDFVWGIWAEVSKEHFARFGSLWDVKVREHEPPMPGILANEIQLYPSALGLKCSIRMQNDRRRPSFVIEADDHPLAVEQRAGITLERVTEIASLAFEHRK
jgi:hypothetical protein